MPAGEEEKNDALKFAMKLIGLRRRSEHEIRQRLQKKGVSEETSEAVIAELYRYAYLDDGAFAESFISDRINLHPSGRMLIKMELNSRGIGDKIIEEKLSELLSEEREAELAKKLFDKKLQTLDLRDGRKAKLKMMSFLQRKGFSSSVISQLMKNNIKLDKDIHLEQ